MITTNINGDSKFLNKKVEIQTKDVFEEDEAVTRKILTMLLSEMFEKIKSTLHS